MHEEMDYFAEGTMTIVGGTLISSVDKTIPGW